MTTKQQIIIIASIIGVILLGTGTWFFFFRSSPPTTTTPPTNAFGTAVDNSNSITSNTSSTDQNGTQQINNTPQQQTTQQKIFQIANVAVVGATFVQTLHPTTTLARYIEQDNGHVFDLPLDVPGAVPRVVSNVTIPGGARAVWVEGGSAAVMQYLSGNLIKTVYLGFPPATTTGATLPTKIQFLPDNIQDIAASPDSKRVVYLLPTNSGVDGYTAKSNGTNAAKLFSLPLSQVLISWPAPGTLLAQTKSATGINGIAFSVDTKTGAIVPLIYTSGLTATADATFSNVLYQTDAGGSNASYVHNVKSGLNSLLSFSPFPEKCIWSVLVPTAMYCASPLQHVDVSYLDKWHQGSASVGDAIFSFELSSNYSNIVTVPGGKDGGISSDISTMSLSHDEHYLEFVTKGDRTLWGVRLTQ